MKILVDVEFNGTVAVEVPDDVAEEHRIALAESFALSRIIATADNPDAPDEDFVMELADKIKMPEEQAGEMWDRSHILGIGGSWDICKRV